jgi:hypothetical protein
MQLSQLAVVAAVAEGLGAVLAVADLLVVTLAVVDPQRMLSVV